jgi:hypothetical protein
MASPSPSSCNGRGVCIVVSSGVPAGVAVKKKIKKDLTIRMKWDIKG